MDLTGGSTVVTGGASGLGLATVRALAARGVSWSYGTLTTELAFSDSGPIVGRQRVTRRYTLEPAGSGRTGVLATVNYNAATDTLTFTADGGQADAVTLSLPAANTLRIKCRNAFESSATPVL